MNRRTPILFLVISGTLQHALPAIVMLILSALRAVLTSTIVMWRNVPAEIDRMARIWVSEALSLGFDGRWDRQLYTLMWWIAFFTFVIGYILSAYITVCLVKLIIF